MILFTTILGAIVLFAVYLFFHTFWRPKDFPPGPFALPVIGNIHLLGSEPQKVCKRLSRKYGDVFSMYFGGWKVVIINSIEAANEALIKKAADFAGRPPSITGMETARGKATGRGIDIVFSDYGLYWRTIRKTAHQALKMYGTNREHLEEVIHTHTSQLVQRLEKKNAIEFDPKNDICLTSTNIICTIVFGSQYNIEDEEFLTILYYNKIMFEGLAGANGVDFLTWLRFFPNRNINLLRESASLSDPILEKWLQKHRETYEEGKIRDFTDALICAADNEIKEDNSSKHFLKQDNIIMIMADVFNAAIETTATTMRWFIAYITIWPDVQKKIHAELDRVIGRDRVPCMNDRTSLPYFEACINETARLASVAPFAVPHQTTCDTSVGGYKVPKKTHVFFNLYAIHHDERHWKDAEEFRPERWLDESGNYTPGCHQSFLPFSAGKRVCFGEALAKMELFLILSRVFQCFEFKKPPSGELPSLDGSVFLTHEPRPYKVIANKRA
eukprot:gene7699-8536_t